MSNSGISQEDVLTWVEDCLEHCKAIESKLKGVSVEGKPILQRALIQEGGHHVDTLHRLFHNLQESLYNKRIQNG